MLGLKLNHVSENGPQELFQYTHDIYSDHFTQSFHTPLSLSSCMKYMVTLDRDLSRVDSIAPGNLYTRISVFSEYTTTRGT